MSRIISIVSTGPGHVGLLTEHARQAILDADEVFATGQAAGTLTSLRQDWRIMPLSNMVELAMESKKSKLALLIQGDSGFFDMGQTLAHQLGSCAQVVCYPGICSLQYLCAKTGQDYQNIVTFPYGSQNLFAALAFHQKIAILLEGTQIPDHVCRKLCDAGLGDISVTVGVRLATGRERIVQDQAFALRDYEFQTPAVMILENPKPAVQSKTIFDTDLTLNSYAIPEEMRWNAANLLQIRPEDKIVHLGAGCGELSVELARHACKGMVFAVEENANCITLLEQNRQAMGYFHLTIHSGDAQQILEEQLKFSPDVVVVGAQFTNLSNALEYLITKTKKKMRVLVVADTLEQLSNAQSVLSSLLASPIEVSQLAISHARTAGEHTMMIAGKTIFFVCSGCQSLQHMDSIFMP